MANRVLAMTLRDDRGSDIPLSRWAICCPFSLLYGSKTGHAEAVSKNERGCLTSQGFHARLLHVVLNFCHLLCKAIRLTQISST